MLKLILSKFFTPAFLIFRLRLRTDSSLAIDENSALVRLRSSYFLLRSTEDSVSDLFSNYLYDSGWTESKSQNIAVRKGELIPWLTYPLLHEIDSWKFSGLKILEFGSGASTVFFSRRGGEVTSYEFDQDYFSSVMVPIRDLLSTSTSLRYLETLPSENEPSFAALRETLSEAELILIDGGPRNKIAALAARYSGEDAVIIFDNSDLKENLEGVLCLGRAGFVELPFHGIGPLNPYSWTSSIFVRNLAALVAMRVPGE